MTRAVAYVVAFLAAAVAGWLIPALAMRALAPSLEISPLRTENFRGRRVHVGLGIVWAVWAVSLLAVDAILEVVGQMSAASFGSVEMLLFDGPLTLSLYAVPIILTLSAVVFGMADDVFGGHGDRGFRGHLSALASGRLTTGGLKLLGIGLVSAVYARSAVLARPGYDSAPVGVAVVWWIAATLVIALSANLFNLLDLRPGRALKAYIPAGVVAGGIFALDAVARYREYLQGATNWTAADTGVSVACTILVVLGPAIAVWRYDLGERGMLGDAGSNAMGAVVGYLVAGSLPLPWIGGLALALIALNVLSERVSFTRVIERSAVLSYLDGLGRLPEETSGASGSEARQ